MSALLIGVPHYPPNDFPDISTVRNDDWIRLAAREVDTTEEDVRRRLARYAKYCGFTAPTID
ncbi:hypothetical protein [Actinoplanes regularis]|uniref:hypothetical protein n=1 Tax=Actinoplanes regularis TaxID=52697 RepID=UPI002553275F|nr:hypothetical protein [Actinoplanes regularis]